MMTAITIAWSVLKWLFTSKLGHFVLFLVFCTGMCLFVGFKYYYKGKAADKADLASANKTIASLIATESTNQKTIATLQGANKKYKEESDIWKAKTKQALDDLGSLSTQRDSWLVKEKELEQELSNADSTAGAWYNGYVPDSVSNQLRNALSSNPDKVH